MQRQYVRRLRKATKGKGGGKICLVRCHHSNGRTSHGGQTIGADWKTHHAPQKIGLQGISIITKNAISHKAQDLFLLEYCDHLQNEVSLESRTVSEHASSESGVIQRSSHTSCLAFSLSPQNSCSELPLNDQNHFVFPGFS